MTATHADMMQELGLAPVWVRRRVAAMAAGAATSAASDAALPGGVLNIDAELADGGAPTAPLTFQPIALSPHERAARAARIATLDFDALVTDIASCTACGLCATRNRTVPGVGDLQADWLFVGEAPGAEENAKGEPFVGQAGRLLDNMLAALAMTRTSHVYIANILKCRPPGNRAPEPAEAEACRPYLERQVALLQPQLIVALGRSAAAQLLNVDAPIGTLRGSVHHYLDIPLVVTYHPAYLLRNLPDKAKAWKDLLLAKATAGAAQAST